MVKITKGIKLLLGIYIFFMLADITTTLLNHKYLIYLESNPLYMVFKSLTPAIILNILYIGILFFAYMSAQKKNSLGTRFLICNVVTWSSVARIYAITRAIQIYNLQPSIEQVEAVTTATKTTNYGLIVLCLMLLPMLLTQITFWLFKLDHKIEILLPPP